GGGQQVAPHVGQQGQARFGRGIPFIGDIVGRAREVVDGHDGRAQGRRTQPGGDREVLVVPDGARQGGRRWIVGSVGPVGRGRLAGWGHGRDVGSDMHSGRN